MWAIRRSANSSRCLIHRVVAQNICLERDILTKNIDCKNQQLKENSVQSSNILRSYELFNSTRSIVWSHNLSSTSGAQSNDDLEDGFSDLDDPKADGSKDDDILEEEVDETDGSVLITSGPQMESNSQMRQMGVLNSSPLFDMLMTTTRKSIHASLNQWVKEGKPLGKQEVDIAMINLRRRKIYGKALELIQWLEENKHNDFTEFEYATCVDLIARMHGIQKAEKYIDQLPEPFKTQGVYIAFLANCANSGNIKKSKEIFNKIRKLGPLTSFSCTQLLILYKRDHQKVLDVVKLMQKEGVKYTCFTYQILIDVKGRLNDIQGIEDIVETMNAEGIDLTAATKATIAKYYILAKQNDKAEALLKEIEGDNTNENRDVVGILLPLYALLGKADDVSRIWKVCESNPTIEECSAAIEAFGMLGKVENAEKVFEHMSKTWKQLSPRYYNNLLKIYADHKLLSKVNDLVKRMIEDRRVMGPLTWDLLVKLFAEEGEVENADFLLSKAVENIPSGLRMRYKPLFSTYMVILDNHARKGNVHNAEKIFDKMRRDEYVGHSKMYSTLLKAYIKARMPAYGIRERMKADSVVPNLPLKRQLVEVDNFAKA